MIRTLYHGSDHIIEHPEFGKGKPYNDYGMGFYCTENADMAKEWAAGRDRDGYANAYELDCEGLTTLDLGSHEYCILNWLAVLLRNREFDAPSPLAQEAKDYLLAAFAVDATSADIMIGYRADDSYFSFAQDFINGTISLRQLSRAMHLGKLGQQVVVKSREAFDRLRFIGYEPVDNKEWYARKATRDRAARREYFDVERNRRQRGDLYVTQILDEEMKPNDPRLR